MTQTIPVRQRVIFLAFIVSGLLYLDRFVLSYVERLIRADLALTEQEIGWGLSAFFISYALGQVPSGWLTDRFGPRRMLSIYILAWSAATALLGAVHGLAMLLAVRLAMGLAQAGAYPTCASIVGRWVPVARRGFANALVTFGGRLGVACAPLLTALLLIVFANRTSPPKVSADEILAPLHLAEQLQFAATHVDLADASAEIQTRLSILKRVAAGLTDDERTAVTQDAALYVQQFEALGKLVEKNASTAARRFGSGPPDSTQAERLRGGESLANQRVLLQGALERAVEGPLLASPDEIERLPVEREVGRALSRSELDPAGRLRVNRLILEAALPGSLRQLYARGWRPVMWIYGSIGIAVALMFWGAVRDRPASHPKITPAELALIEQDRPIETSGSTIHRLPVREILQSRSLWLISFLQFFTNIGWTFLVLQLPKYLEEVQHCSLEVRSWHSTIPIWAGWVGMLLGGWFTDWCVRRLGLRLGRMIPLAGTRLLAAGAFAIMASSPSLWTATLMLSVVAFSTDVGVPAVWAYNQDVGGRFVGSVLGWGNMWGNFGSAASPLIVTEALRRSGTWDVPFLIFAVAFVLAGICGLFIDATAPIESQSPGAAAR